MARDNDFTMASKLKTILIIFLLAAPELNILKDIRVVAIRSLELSESNGFYSKDGQWTEFSAGKANSNGEPALDPNFTSERKVPNGSDPLHNR
ncbi:hypothetical protein SUGI_0485720 [Cryptomeria japonica]|nr:hypothetical protein SUGI_0485720 [Cryptomeria japonica]